MTQPTEADLTGRLALYLEAERAILSGAQEYSVGQGSTARKLTRADLAVIASTIKEIRAEITLLYPVAPVRRIALLRPRW